MRRSLTWLLLAILVCLPSNVRGDSLRSLRDDVRTEREEKSWHDSDKETQRNADRNEREVYKSSHRGDATGSSYSPADDDDTMSLETLGGLFVVGAFAVTSPFWAPNALVERGTPGAGYFSPYPYHNDQGYMVFESATTSHETIDNAYDWATRVRGEYGDNFDSLTRWGGHILTEHRNRLGFDGEVNYWREELAGDGHDELWTGDANVVYRFAQSERVQFRSGVGLAWLEDRAATELGFNFTYGADFYPMKPLVISTEMDAGWLGEAWMIHLRATLGVQWRQAEVFTGYDYREIGNTQLDGFVAGVRLLF